MSRSKMLLFGGVVAIAMALMFGMGGCGGGSPAGPTAPTATLSASPSGVEKGEPVTLTWQTSNATSVSISGIGAVAASGTKQVTPSSTTTYTLTAQGPGGTQKASTNVLVTTTPIQHVVIIFQENRTPDNLFQDAVLVNRGADIQNYGINSKQQKIQLQPVPLAADWDLGHSHGSFTKMYDGGKMDGADKVGKFCDPGFHCGTPPPNFQFSYVQAQDVTPYYQMAETYTFGDRMSVV